MPIFKRDSGPAGEQPEEHRLQAKVVSPDLDSDPEARVVGVVPEDDVFGTVDGDGPNYRNVGWIATAVLMFKTQVGLGVLSLPSVLHTLGIVPGTITLLAVGALSTWGMYVTGKFKSRYPQVYSFADVGFMLAGQPGRIVCAVAYWLYMTIIAGSGLLSISIAFNSMSLHGTCTAVFVVVATIITFILASIQTLEKIAWITYAGFISLVVSLLVVTIGVGVADRPAEAPQTGPWDKDLHVFNNPTFGQAMGAIGQQVLSVGATPAFFSIKSEMRNPNMYNRSLLLCQLSSMSFYIAIATTTYYYAGQYIASPAFGSAGVLIKRIAYGLALPALFVSCTIYTHVPAKWIFVNILKGSEHLTKNTFKHWITWFACVLGCVLFSYVVASAVPVFNGLVGLVGALFGAFLCILVTSLMWIYLYGAEWRTGGTKLKLAVAAHILMALAGAFLMVGGTYGSILDIKASFDSGDTASPWGCADNSNSV